MDFYKTKSVEFGFCSNAYKPGVVVLNDPQTYKDNRPTPFGVQSLLLGATRRFPCAQCKLRYGSGSNSCPGHEGQFKLNTVVYAPGTIKYIVNILRKVCFFCSALLKSRGKDVPHGKRTCSECKMCQPVHWSLVYGIRIVPLWAKNSSDDCPTLNSIDDQRIKDIALSKFGPQTAHRILNRIKFSDFKFLGFHNPEKTQPKFFVWEYMPVVSTKFRPRCIRPGMTGKGLHDLTTLYHQLLKASLDVVKVRERIALYHELRGNISLLRKNDLNEHKYTDLLYKSDSMEDDIQVLVWLIVLGQDPRKTANKVKKTMYMKDQFVPQIPKSQIRMGGEGHASLLGLAVGNDKVHSITRGHISSKRCDMNARTVIAADPHIDIGYVGVPHTICKTLTFPEVVNRYNIKWLQKMVVNGSTHLFGANAIRKREDSNAFSTSFVPNIGLNKAKLEQRKSFAQKLEIGDVVERHLVEGDPVVMNRQPTLHEGSIMGHKCKPVPGNAFKIPLYDVNSYNADFDGDEMNLHVPQNYKARSDVLHVMGVMHHLLPSQMVVQGGILACYMMTSMDCILNPEEYMNYVANLPTFDQEPVIWAKNRKGDFDTYHTGCQLFSQVLDKQAVVDTWDGKGMPSSSHILIRNGQFLSGRASKPMLKKLLNNLCLTTNPQTASKFMTNTSRITYHFLANRPKSIGPADMRPTQSLHEKVQFIIETCTKIVSDYASKLEDEELQHALMIIMNVVSSHTKAAIPVQESQRTTLHIITTDAKSKGAFHNQVQIQCYHGTNLLKGNPIVHDDPSAKRILPCFVPNTPRSELLQFGHVVHSFIQGHSSVESFLDYMSGRVGLVDTAVTTGRTGYKGAEIGVNTTCRVAYGNWVLNHDMLLSPIYYGDGYNPDYVVYRKVVEFQMDHDAFVAYLEELPLLPGMEVELDNLRTDIMETKARSCMESLNSTLDLPYDVQELFTSEYYMYHSEIDANTVPLVPTTSWALLEKLHTNIAKWATAQSARIVKFYDILHLAKLMQESKFATAFSDTKFFQKVLFRMEKCFACTLYAGGSQCGRSASMRISEKVTQIALDSHRSGGANHGCDGLKRFETMLSLSKTPQYMASMMIDCKSKEEAYKVAKSITMVMFESIAKSIQVENAQDHMEEDQDIVELAQDLCRLGGTNSHFFPQKNHATYRSKKKSFTISTKVIRVVLDKSKCLEASVDISRVMSKIESRFLAFLTPVSTAKTRAHFVSSASYMNDWKIRIMITQKIHDGLLKKGKSLDMFLKSSVLRNMFVGGIENISYAHVGEREELGLDEMHKKFVKRTIPYVWTRGTNLRDAMSHKMIDPLKIVSNCVQDVRENLGTLAACNAFYCEMKDVMGNKVKDRHVFLLTQSILTNGIICSVNRHGLKKSGTPISQMCFENGRKVVMNLSMVNAKDACQDDASAILLGRRSKGGTGAVHFKPADTHVKRKLAHFDTTNAMPFRNIVDTVRSRHFSKKNTKRMRVEHEKDEEEDAEIRKAAMTQSVSTWFGIDTQDTQEDPPKAYEPSPAKKTTFAGYSPASPTYAPTSPNAVPYSPTYVPYSPNAVPYSPTSPVYNPSSPQFSDEDGEESYESVHDDDYEGGEGEEPNSYNY